MTHVALLGDSVIDNKAYVGDAPDVAQQLRLIAPKEWKVSKQAVDGAVVSGVLRQLSNVPVDATHVVISAGGNDALHYSGVLDAPASSVSDALLRLAKIQDEYRAGYSRMLDMAQRLRLPTAVLKRQGGGSPLSRSRSSTTRSPAKPLNAALTS